MKRRDYLISMEQVNGSIIYPPEVYHGTLNEAKREGKSMYIAELKKGGRLIIQGEDGEIVAERIYDVWLDYTDF